MYSCRTCWAGPSNHLKQDPATRHIPVQMLTLDEDRHHGLARGAFAFVTKPTSPEELESASVIVSSEYAAPRRKRLLIVEDNAGRATEHPGAARLRRHRRDRRRYRSGSSGTGGRESFDCVVLDLRLPDMTGFEILERLSDNPQVSELPVVVFTGKELSPEEDARLHTLARSVVVKGVESPERLLDETALFLHRVVADLPAEKQKMLDRLHRSDEALVGKKVLVVDDDVRNIFALSSVLERRGMTVLTAGTGREAITTLESTPDMAIVLMDIMMPEMDGYETMQVIRQNPLVPAAADHCADGESDERRPREVPGSGRIRISGEAGQYRAVAFRACACGCTDSVDSSIRMHDGRSNALVESTE